MCIKTAHMQRIINNPLHGVVHGVTGVHNDIDDDDSCCTINCHHHVQEDIKKSHLAISSSISTQSKTDNVTLCGSPFYFDFVHFGANENQENTNADDYECSKLDDDDHEEKFKDHTIDDENWYNYGSSYYQNYVEETKEQDISNDTITSRRCTNATYAPDTSELYHHQYIHEDEKKENDDDGYEGDSEVENDKYYEYLYCQKYDATASVVIADTMKNRLQQQQQQQQEQCTTNECNDCCCCCSQKKKSVSFSDVCLVVEIPHHSEYDVEQRMQLWTPADMIEKLAYRSLFEFYFEGNEWNKCFEENAFLSCHDATTGCTNSNNNDNHSNNFVQFHPALVFSVITKIVMKEKNDGRNKSSSNACNQALCRLASKVFLFPEEEKLIKDHLSKCLVQDLLLGIF